MLQSFVLVRWSPHKARAAASCLAGVHTPRPNFHPASVPLEVWISARAIQHRARDPRRPLATAHSGLLREYLCVGCPLGALLLQRVTAPGREDFSTPTSFTLQCLTRRRRRSAIARHEQYKLSPKTTRRTIYRVEHTCRY